MKLIFNPAKISWAALNKQLTEVSDLDELNQLLVDMEAHSAPRSYIMRLKQRIAAVERRAKHESYSSRL